MKEQPLLLSISQDPSSASKMNKCERIDSLPTERGDTGNFVRVLTNLAGSDTMLVFPRDSVEVLSRPAGSGATPRMKLKL